MTPGVGVNPFVAEPGGAVRKVIYPVAGESMLKALAAKTAANEARYRARGRTVLRSSYSKPLAADDAILRPQDPDRSFSGFCHQFAPRTERRWGGTIGLIGILKEAEFATGFTGE
ncbi:hypothetical protein ACIPJM_18300 [Streptomyces halstedii]|uniref:hypothetical protein n=1 Tax=Streptomyces halstedii TaxID=1944 RepID=UPI003811B066